MKRKAVSSIDPSNPETLSTYEELPMVADNSNEEVMQRKFVRAKRPALVKTPALNGFRLQQDLVSQS
jgi:hypothetical protein